MQNKFDHYMKAIIAERMFLAVMLSSAVILTDSCHTYIMWWHLCCSKYKNVSHGIDLTVIKANLLIS